MGKRSRTMKQLRTLLFHPISIRIITVGLNFLSNVLINRSLGIEVKGQMTRIQNYANFLQILLNLGLCYAYPMLIQKYGNKLAKSFLVTVIWIQTFFWGTISGIISICFYDLNNFLTSVLFIVMLCNSQIIFIALIDDINSRNKILLASTIGYIIANIIAIILASGNLYVILGILISKYFVETIVCCHKCFYFVFSLKSVSKELLKTTLSIGLPTAIVAALISCNYNIDIFMLDFYKSSDIQVGLFGVAYSLSNMLWFIPDAFKEMVYNRTTKDSKYDFVLRYIISNMLICIIICFGFIILGKWFLGFVYGEEYIAAFRVCVTLFIGVIPMIAFKLIHPIYINNGRVVPVAVLLAISVLINAVLSFFFIPIYGAFGAALSCVGSYSVCGVLFFGMFYKDYLHGSVHSMLQNKDANVNVP